MPDAELDDLEAPLDGRTRRALRTRAAIVDATIALVEQGDLRPTAPRVAEAAKVSVRSIFQHFDDLETLHAAVAERLVERVARLVVAVPADDPFEERLPRFVHQRALLLEAVTPIRRAANVHGPFSTEIAARLRDGQAYLRAEAERTFAPELDRAGPERAELLDALDAALSWSTWEHLRAGLGRDQPAAEAALVRLARGLLA
jgi:TetR/AcrR family transcriptional regulator of autoinduction and epiphytic fitness